MVRKCIKSITTTETHTASGSGGMRMDRNGLNSITKTAKNTARGSGGMRMVRNGVNSITKMEYEYNKQRLSMEHFTEVEIDAVRWAFDAKLPDPAVERILLARIEKRDY